MSSDTVERPAGSSNLAWVITLLGASVLFLVVLGAVATWYWTGAGERQHAAVCREFQGYVRTWKRRWGHRWRPLWRQGRGKCQPPLLKSG